MKTVPHRNKLLDFKYPRPTVCFGANFNLDNPTVRCGAVKTHAPHRTVKALVRWASGKRLTFRLPKLSLMTLSPTSEQRDSWSSYGALRAYSEVLYNLWGPRESDLSDS